MNGVPEFAIPRPSANEPPEKYQEKEAAPTVLAEMERAAAGLPTEQKAAPIRTVADVIEPYLAAYKLNHRPKSVLFAMGRLAHVKKALGTRVLSDLTDDRILEYIRRRQGQKYLAARSTWRWAS